MTDMGKLIVLPSLRTHLTDLAIMNAIALVPAIIAYSSGYQFLHVFVFVLFFMSGLTLIIGGFAGFIVSSATYYAFSKLLKRESNSTVANIEIKQSNQGGRIVMLGTVILVESIVLAWIII